MALRVLGAAFATVPGANPHSAAFIAMASALRAEMDFVTVKPPNLAYQGRLGEARLFRVPVQGTPAEQRAGFARAVRRQVESEAYDVVHVRDPIAGVALADHKRNMDFRLLYEVSGFADESEGPTINQEWTAAHRECLELADLILVSGDAAARALADQGFAGKAAVVPPGVEVDTFDWWPSAPSETLRLLFLGAFAADREIPTLLAAIRSVREAMPVRALLAGERLPERRARMRRLAADFGIADLVDVRGEARATTVPRLIAACDIGVVTASSVPRFQELGGLPEPLLEFLACRRPIVVAAVPAIAEVVRDEREGLLYLPSDDHSLAEAILTMARDPELRRRLVESGYEHVRKNFSMGARRRRIAEIYSMIAPGTQHYDAWRDAFDSDVGTGDHMLPPSSSVAFALEELQTTSGTDRDTLIGEWAPSTSVEAMDEIVRRSSRPPPPPPSAELRTADTDPGAPET
jgi:glycosyltransferase involved in cell wall biosynthesis